MKKYWLAAIAFVVLCHFGWTYGDDSLFVWYGNPDGSPMGAIIGEPLDIGVTARVNQTDTVYFLHLCLGGINSSIDSFLSQTEGGVYNVLSLWDDVAYLAPEGSPPNQAGWKSQSLLGFCDIGGDDNPPLVYTEPTLIAIFAAKIKYDSTLVGDTIDALGIGINSHDGGSQAANVDEVIPVIEHFSPIYFMYPNDGAVISGEVIDYQMGIPAPLAGMRIEVLGTRKFAVSSVTGDFAIDRIIPDNYQLKCTHPNFDDTTIEIMAAIGETLDVNIDLHTGSLTGVVFDDAAVPIIRVEGAVVTVTGSIKSDTTDVNGEFQINRLYPGNYELVFKNINYEVDTVSGVVVNPEAITVCNDTMTHLQRCDLGITAVSSPPESIQAKTIYYPACMVNNHGTDKQNFDVIAVIRQDGSPQIYYTDTLRNYQLSGFTRASLLFPEPFVPRSKQYDVAFYTVLAADTINDNDTLRMICRDYLPIEYAGATDFQGEAYDIAIDGDYAFVASGSYGLQIINIENPGNPVWAAQRPLEGVSRRISKAGPLGYIAADAGGFDLMLLGNPTRPHLIHSYRNFGKVMDVSVRGDYAYLACLDSGLFVVDITDTLNIHTVGRLSGQGVIHGLTLEGNYIYAACTQIPGNEGMRVIDISIPSNPAPVGQITMQYRNPTDVKIVGDFAYIITAQGGIVIADISIPANPCLVSIIPGYCSEGFELVGNYAYMAAYDKVLVFNLSNVNSPEYVATYRAITCVFGITYSGGMLYLANADAGMQILRIREGGGPIGCDYLPGDINGDNMLGLPDVSYGVRYFKGFGPISPIRCWNDSLSDWLASAGDVNGNCEFHGSDIARLVAYFKELTVLRFCPWTPAQGR